MPVIELLLLDADWRLAPSAGAARRAASAADAFAARFDPADLIVDGEYALRPPRRAVPSVRLPFELRGPADQSIALMVRHADGALAFHFPRPLAMRANARTRKWRCELELAASAPARRGVLAGIVRIVVLRVAERIAGRVLPGLVQQWEHRRRAAHGIVDGCMRIVADGAAVAMRPDAPTLDELAAGPALLLLHGELSDARATFAPLLSSAVMQPWRTHYGDRMFAFEHPTIAADVDANVEALRAALPSGGRYDVIGCGRGGLVARAWLPHAAADRIDVERVVLVATPQQGTPLASPARHRDALDWYANVLDVLPDTPSSMALAWIGSSIGWLAQQASVAMPGLAAMDPEGAVIAALRARAQADLPRCHAIAADWHDPSFAGRLAGVLAQRVFGEPHDLVVPTSSALRAGTSDADAIPPARMLLYRGRERGRQPVHHLNILQQPATSTFLRELLHTAPHSMRGRSARRHAAPDAIAAAEPPMRRSSRATSVPAVAADDTFYLLVIGDPHAATPRPDSVIASYGGARVVDRYRWGRTQNRRTDPPSDADDREGEIAGQRWRRIIAYHQRLIAYFRGTPGAVPLDAAQLDDFGELLFAALFDGAVGRLYDEARGRQGRRLKLVLNSNVPHWAGKPWEFAFDPQRRTYLATQDIHLLRDVIGPISTDVLQARRGPLRLLIAYAQPLDADALSVDEERQVIARGFQPLCDAGLAELDVLPRATPALLHERLSLGYGRYDVLHFIGHGEYDDARGSGVLLFEDARGRSQRVYEREISEIVANRGLRLVFLNACETAAGGGYSDYARGIAPALLRSGVPAVLANQFAVDDAAAVVFAQHVYARLARGEALAEAVREARIAVNYRLSGVSLDWAVPALYTRVPELRLVQPRGARAATAAGAAPPARTRHPRIGVWDAAHRLPQLEAAIAGLNGARGAPQFDAVELAVPLDARRVVPFDGVARRVLDADIALQRLRDAPLQLGLDLLIGLTGMPLCTAGGTPVALHWHRQPDGPVTLVFASIERLPADGPDALREWLRSIVEAAISADADGALATLLARSVRTSQVNDDRGRG